MPLSVKEEWLIGVESVGVTSGASVPEILIRDLLDWLAERGYGDVETVTADRGASSLCNTTRVA